LIHAHDAATAIMAAAHRRSGETLNIVDDDRRRCGSGCQ
jgi:hypothetical protein